VSEATICVVLILTLLAGWYADILDVKGAFLHGKFTDKDKVYLAVPEGFEKYYPTNSVLLLKKTIYGLKQAAYAFWQQLVKAFEAIWNQSQ
jgi:hypothetical protein